jgi:hypothetical protein
MATINPATGELELSFAPVVFKTAAPGAGDNTYVPGTLWINTTADTVYQLIKIVTGTATWTQLG